MKNKMFHYINIRNLSDKAKAVMYIFESNKEFYSLFGKSKYEICLDFTNMINDKRTEEFNSKAIFLNNNIIGAISFYDSDEIYLRQIFSLNYLQNKSPIETNIISSFSNDVPKIKKKSLYLSRIAISDKFQGKGYSTEVLMYLEKEAKKCGYDLISLHVHCNNKKAISIYKKYGFVIENDQHMYYAMEKKLNEIIDTKGSEYVK